MVHSIESIVLGKRTSCYEVNSSENIRYPSPKEKSGGLALIRSDSSIVSRERIVLEKTDHQVLLQTIRKKVVIALVLAVILGRNVYLVGQM